MDTITLQCFLVLTESGSFTKTANRVGRTQSAVSQQIANLENLLGKPLFNRGKTITLNPDGEIFLNYARQIFALHREAMDRFRQPDLEGEIRFGLPEDFATVFLSDVLLDFSRAHPRILLNVECDLTLNLFTRFKEKEFDLVLVKMNLPGDFPNGQDVWSEDLEWVYNGATIDFTKPIPLVLSPQPCVYRSKAINALDKAGIKWRLAFSSPSYAGTTAAVEAGIGVTVLPRTMIPQKLQILVTKQLPILEGLHVSLLKHNSNTSAINSLEEFFMRKFK